MAKIAIIFFAALAFQAVLGSHPGRNQQQRNQEAQELLRQVQSAGSEAANAVQNVQIEDAIRRRSLVSQGNELAHNIHEAVYQLQQAIEHNQGGQGQQVLHEVVKSLSNIVHNVQQALNNEPGQLKAQLKTQVENLVAEAQKLGPVIQQAQHSEHVNDEVEDVLDDLLAAIQQIQVRNRVVGQNQEQIKNQIQTVTNEVSSDIQSISSDDEATVQDLAHHSHHLAHHLGHVIHNLQREVHNHHGDVRSVLQQVVNKLSEVRADLEQAGLNEESNQVSELKNLLKSNIHNISVQVERLVQVAHSNIDNEHEAQDLRNVVQSVLARSQVAARQLQRDVEATEKNHQ